MRFSTFPEAMSMTETSPDPPLAVKPFRPSELRPIPHGRIPTSSMDRTAFRSTTSIAAIDLARPSETNS
jgi:hypothetical protein